MWCIIELPAKYEQVSPGTRISAKNADYINYFAENNIKWEYVSTPFYSDILTYTIDVEDEQDVTFHKLKMDI